MEVNDNIEESAGKCSLCGNALTAFGSKPLADGVLCRDCAKIVSEWLSDEDLRGMKLAKVKRHFAYRAKNAEKLQSFTPTQSLDAKYDLHIDENAKTFVISKKKDFVKDNADVLKLSSIKDVQILEEACEGENAGVDVMLEMHLRGWYIKHVKFRVNEFPGLEKDSEDYIKTKETAEAYLRMLGRM